MFELRMFLEMRGEKSTIWKLMTVQFDFQVVMLCGWSCVASFRQLAIINTGALLRFRVCVDENTRDSLEIQNSLPVVGVSRGLLLVAYFS